MHTVGIDIGGTQLRAAIFDEEMKLIDSYKTANDRTMSAEQNMDKLLDFIMSKSYVYGGIGVGCPGPLDTKAGKIINPPNLVGWDGFELVRYVEEKTRIKTILNNDANVAGLSEALLGAGKGYDSVVFIGISTGIGGAYIYQRKLVNGAHSNAAEFWNMIVNEDDHHHKNANAGSLNEQSSGSGLLTIASEKYGKNVTPKELFELYYENDAVAVEIIERAADVLAKGIANITCTIDPDLFIVGGSVAIYNREFVELVEEKAKKYMIDPRSLKIEMAKFGDDAGLIGASLLV